MDKEVQKVIVKYKMDETESLAYTVGLIWVEKSRKAFPDYKNAGMGRGDPRKSYLFKLCYKLIRETKGLVKDDEFHLYIRAQIDILKNIKIGDGHPSVDAGCLIGDKAWRRWKLWKRRYDSLANMKTDAAPSKVSNQKILDALRKSKTFLKAELGESPAMSEYVKAESDGALYRWINFGKISPYYVVMSPFVSKVVREEMLSRLNFDVKLYESGVDEYAKTFFRKTFPNEFS